MKTLVHNPGILLLVSVFLGASVGGCNKKADADKEMEKKAEALGEALGSKMVVDMTKTQFAAAKQKFAKGESAKDECSGLLSVRSDVAEDKSADAAKLIQDISSFCILDVKLTPHVATVKRQHDEMLAARKKKDRSSEQMSWAGFSVDCASFKREFAELKEHKLDSDPKAKDLENQINQLCTPENLARKKYFT